MTLLARIKVHSQQICGLAWSPNGTQFATGGNDNLCCLFDVDKVIGTEEKGSPEAEPTTRSETAATEPRSPRTSASSDGAALSRSEDASEPGSTRSSVKYLPAGSAKHRWRHAAAVKAIAFCPWREGLIATGGGSNDKCIHFYHASSGAALATISVAAQVTSLIWSTTRREIAATFGYAQPDHPYRIADGEHRALYAIAYPGGPSDTYRTKERLRSRTAEEGCIVVASSDESVKFHEVWMAGRKATTLGSGVLAGSDILEMGEGIDKEGDPSPDIIEFYHHQPRPPPQPSDSSHQRADDAFEYQPSDGHGDASQLGFATVSPRLTGSGGYLGNHTCLTRQEGLNITAKYADLIGAFTVEKAEALLSDDFSDTSDSINTLSGKPLGSATFPTKDDFIREQSNFPAIPLDVKSVDAITCDTVVLRWTQTFGESAQPVAGMTVLVAFKGGDDDDDDDWKLKTVYTEFNSLIYLHDIGGNYTLPASMAR
ncbi:Uu.00g062810.m01.CDS01 [Anthostomella pinea]|uniref:Uu.00g062810.m01.CDS01 n=1 Tax=Anthostomella pinea TaxID=933095 RepID=A0AAI8YN24_9PEZI|nr:Uu.00g062810.m01.CDS01 [Anthostomella pinea]